MNWTVGPLVINNYTSEKKVSILHQSLAVADKNNATREKVEYVAEIVMSAADGYFINGNEFQGFQPRTRIVGREIPFLHIFYKIAADTKMYVNDHSAGIEHEEDTRLYITACYRSAECEASKALDRVC